MLCSGTLSLSLTAKMFSSIVNSQRVYLYRLALLWVFVKQRENVVNTALNDAMIRSG